jgi:putative membrane protein
MAATVLSNLGWRPLPDNIGWQRVSSAHIATLAIGLSPLVVAATIELFIWPLVAAGLLGVYLLAVAIRWLDWRRTAWALDGDRLLMRSGWWRRRTVILPTDKIQSTDLLESVFSRWFGIATLAFGVPGGSGFSAYRLTALPRETARILRRQLLA